jgi:hypothetical protein
MKDPGARIHVVAGFLVVGGCLGLFVFGAGLTREVLEHGWLTAHQLWEGVAWGAGGLGAFCLGLLGLRLAKGRW